jgi:excisionase family DNA binding protein
MHRYYTTFEAARLLGVSLPTVVNWIKARRLKAHRTPGGHRRIRREELAAFMVRHGMPLPLELTGAVQGRRKALVVAGGGPAREGLVRILAAAGYAVEQASPGFAAGAAAARFEPDVLVVQPDAPDGGEAVRGPRSDRELAEVPVVAVAPRAWHEPLAAAGCAAIVEAPPPGGALAEEVARVLGAGASAARPEGAPRRAAGKARSRRSRAPGGPVAD